MISINDLIRDLTPEEVLGDLLEIAKALKLSTTAWEPGRPIHKLLTTFATQLSVYWNRYIVQAIRSGFLDYAEGVWLTLLAFCMYGVSRNEATFATGAVRIENRTTNFFSFAAGEIRVKNGQTGQTYLSTTGGVLVPWSGAGGFPSLALVVQADEIGSASSAATSSIEGFPMALATGPAGVYALPNAAPFIGSDEELDADLVTRCRASTGLLSVGGPRAAYEFVALSVRRTAAGGIVLPGQAGYSVATPVNVNRVRVVNVGNGVVRVWLAAPSGAASGNASTAGTDVFAVNAAIQTYVVPPGITCTVASAVATSAPYSIALTVDRATLLTAAEAVAAADTAVKAFFSALAIGGAHLTPGPNGFVFASEVGAKASEAVKGIVRASVTGGDVSLTEGQVAVQALTITATLVTQ